MNLDDYLADCEGRYDADAGLLRQAQENRGFHTNIPHGSWAHPTAPSIDYAIALLRQDDPETWRRAARIADTVLGLQVTDPYEAHYGLWPYVMEEPVPMMDVPDRNWADFCGMRLAEVWRDGESKIPEELRARILRAIHHAAGAVYRGNIQPGYSNIAIMGGGLCAVAGEILDDMRMLEYGRRRLQAVAERTREHGALNEYNSPTYTMIALHETERALSLLTDEPARASAEFLRVAAWEMLAAHFHPPTGQLAGPQSRAYSDHLPWVTLEKLGERLGFSLHPPGRAAPPPIWSGLNDLTVIPIPCPTHLREKFRAVPAEPVFARRRYIKRESDAVSVFGSTWMDREACLGSVSFDNCFSQRRPVLAYWPTPDDPAVVFTATFLCDGKPTSAIMIRCHQAGRSVLAAFNPIHDLGKYALHMDRREDGLIEAGDLRVRCKLTGKGVALRETDDGRHALAAGGWLVAVQGVNGIFDGGPVRWEAGEDGDGSVWVDGVCHQGAGRWWHFKQLVHTRVAVGLQLLRDGETPAADQPTWLPVSGQDDAVCEWPSQGLRVAVPAGAERYRWATGRGPQEARR